MYILSADKLDYEFEEATVSFIYKNNGDSVNVGDEIMELITAKAVIVIETPVAGVVNEISVKLEDTVSLETKLCAIEQI